MIGRDSKAGRAVESFIEKKGEGFRSALAGSCWLGEAGGRAPFVTILEAHLAFSVGPELDVREKTREAGSR